VRPPARHCLDNVHCCHRAAAKVIWLKFHILKIVT
jgi:hypothetical protein